MSTYPDAGPQTSYLGRKSTFQYFDSYYNTATYLAQYYFYCIIWRLFGCIYGVHHAVHKDAVVNQQTSQDINNFVYIYFPFSNCMGVLLHALLRALREYGS